MNKLEQIQQEITSTVNQERAAEHEAQQRELETRNRWQSARDRMAAALDAGNLEDYKAAGTDAESLRLEVEFIEESKKRGRKSAAGTDDDKRIRAGLVAEGARIRADALAQLRQIFTEAADVAGGALQQFAVLDALLSSWDLTVMKRDSARKVCADNDRLVFGQLANAAKAQLNKFNQLGV